ncbi:hypothetical protein C8R43DRAFT_960216 [Mycena crocata]|nr:hypothetical protein C8R43DRAFT_960216 [Mycena crocata]
MFARNTAHVPQSSEVGTASSAHAFPRSAAAASVWASLAWDSAIAFDFFGTRVERRGAGAGGSGTAGAGGIIGAAPGSTGASGAFGTCGTVAGGGLSGSCAGAGGSGILKSRHAKLPSRCASENM